MRLQRLLDALSALQRRHALLLFLALGALLFAADGLRRSTPTLEAPAAAAQAPQQWLEDEVLYREAIARGLDDGDLIIRRRLVQKMRLLLEASVDVAEPGEQELRDWIAQHPARYGGLARISLDQVFLSRARRDSRLAADAEVLGARLRGGIADSELRALSDPHPAGTRLDGADPRLLEREFGHALAQQLAELPAGEWQGPLASSLGLHFIRVRSRDARVPELDSVRERAQRDWLLEQRRAQSRVALERLMARYGAAP